MLKNINFLRYGKVKVIIFLEIKFFLIEARLIYVKTALKEQKYGHKKSP
jgi:hypothetical protein